MECRVWNYKLYINIDNRYKIMWIQNIYQFLMNKMIIIIWKYV